MPNHGELALLTFFSFFFLVNKTGKEKNGTPLLATPLLLLLSLALPFLYVDYIYIMIHLVSWFDSYSTIHVANYYTLSSYCQC